MRLIDKNIAYLVIQPSTRLFATADTLSSQDYLNPADSFGTVTKKGFSGIPIFIPIPLISYFSGVQRFLGFQEIGHVKSNNVLTSTASNIINSTSQAEIDVKLKSGNRSTTFATRGSGTFQIDILVGINNLFEFIFEGYMEFASKYLFNTRFHYISNSTLSFNMILSSYNKDRTQGMNSRYTLIFTKPEIGFSTIDSTSKPNVKTSTVTKVLL